AAGSTEYLRSQLLIQTSRQDRKRALTIEERIEEGAEVEAIGRHLRGDVRMAGQDEAPDGLGEEQFARPGLVEEAGEQSIDPLVTLALRAEGPEAEAGHRGIDPDRIGVFRTADDERGPPD